MAFPGKESLRGRLAQLQLAGTVIAEVYVLATQIPGEPDLTAVTVKELQGDFVIFNQAGSGGLGDIIVLIDKIVAIDITG